MTPCLWLNESENSLKCLVLSLSCFWSLWKQIIINWSRLLRVRWRNLWFCSHFWTILPPEMTPNTPWWLLNESENSLKCLILSLSCVWRLSKRVIINWGQIPRVRWRKLLFFSHFEQNYPLKWPQWPPGGCYLNLKTVIMFIIPIVTEVYEND